MTRTKNQLLRQKCPPNAIQTLGAGLLSETAWIEVARSLRLSPREVQITRRIFDNFTEPAIAGMLGMSEHTVHGHLNRLFKKLDFTTRVQLVVRVVAELLVLTLSEQSPLPPICRNHANGRCRSS